MHEYTNLSNTVVVEKRLNHIESQQQKNTIVYHKNFFQKQLN